MLSKLRKLVFIIKKLFSIQNKNWLCLIVKFKLFLHLNNSVIE